MADPSSSTHKSAGGTGASAGGSGSASGPGATGEPFVCRWGILATGSIAKVFTRDLVLFSKHGHARGREQGRDSSKDDSSKNASPPSHSHSHSPSDADAAGLGVGAGVGLGAGIEHRVVGVASSSSLAKARAFLREVGLEEEKGTGTGTAIYDSYADLVRAPDVDIVYVATPHAFHYRDVMLCLEAGKHVLCEKPFTINARQAERIFEVAKSKNLFVMEALWTRFFPLTAEVQRLAHGGRDGDGDGDGDGEEGAGEGGVLGRVRRVQSDLSCAFEPDEGHRLYAPHLGGGALLDLGIYALTWQSLILHRHPNNRGAEPRVTSSMIKTRLTGVDEATTIVLSFDELDAQGVATCSMVHNSSEPAVTISGEKADITIARDPFRPQAYTIHHKDKDGKYTKSETRELSIPGNGMIYEADACAAALRDGELESAQCSHADTLFTMRMMDAARRVQVGGFVYPEPLEAV